MLPDQMDNTGLSPRQSAGYLDLPFELIGPDEIRRLHPLVNTAGILGAAWTPETAMLTLRC